MISKKKKKIVHKRGETKRNINDEKRKRTQKKKDKNKTNHKTRTEVTKSIKKWGDLRGARPSSTRSIRVEEGGGGGGDHLVRTLRL